MLALTKRTEYGLIALCHLAKCDGQVVSARDIAEPTRTRVALLMSVLKCLNQKGLLRSTRGANGGYTLARPAADISFAALINAIEGPVRLVKCAPSPDADSGCDLAVTCPVRRPVLRIHEHLESFLSNITIADLVGDATYGSSAVDDRNLDGRLALRTLAITT